MHNLNFWEAFILNAFAVLLRTFIKNPQRYSGIRHVLREIADDINTVFPPDAPSTPASQSGSGN